MQLRAAARDSAMMACGRTADVASLSAMPHLGGPHMLRLLWVVAAISAAGFVAGSATTNAMFLASLGRTGAEGAIYVCVSLAGDLAKVVLPVAITRPYTSTEMRSASAKTACMSCSTSRMA